MVKIDSTQFSEIEKIEINDHDSKFKFIFQYKYFLAYLIKHLFPKIFGEMDLNMILEECFQDPEYPNNSYATLLSSGLRRAGAGQFIEDLVFSVNFPKRYQKDQKRPLSFILDLEPQYYEPTDYLLDNRIKIYNSDLILSQRIYYGLDTARKFYKNFNPVCSVWIISESLKSDPFTTEYWNDSKVIKDYQNITFEEFPPENNFKIYLGDPEDFRNDGLYRFLNTLIEQNSKSIVEMCERIKIPFKKKELTEMNFTQNAIIFNREQGRREGRREGIIEGEIVEKNKATHFFSNLLKDLHLSQEEIDSALRAYQDL